MAGPLMRLRYAFLSTLVLAWPLLAWSSVAHAEVFNPTSFTLGNGLQIIVVPNHLAPVVTQMVWYKVGSADEVSGKTGLAHYLEHLMFRGTSDIPAGEFSKYIAARGGEDNAFTSYDYTAYFETVAAEHLPLIMRMEADRMRNLHITGETAKPELSVVLNERDMRTDNNPEGRFSEKLHHVLMPRHAYGRPVIGWRKEIEKLSPADATDFYEKHYAPNNAVVIISGDVTADDVMRYATSIYGAVPSRTLAKRPALPVSATPSQHTFTIVDAGVEQPQYVWQAVVPSYNTQKAGEAYAYEVLAEALDGGEVGVLYHDLVVEHGFASGVGTQYDPDARGDAIFTIGVTPKSVKDAKKLDAALRDELSVVAQKGIPADKIEAAKKRMQRSAIFARDSLMMPGYAFGMAITTGHDVADVEAWPERIAAVAPDQVNAALRSLVENARYTSGLLLPDAHASRAAREAARPVISHDMGIR